MADTESQTAIDPMRRVEVIAERLDMHPGSLYRALKNGTIDLEYVQVGRRGIRIRESAYQDYVDRNTHNRQSETAISATTDETDATNQ